MKPFTVLLVLAFVVCIVPDEAEGFFPFRFFRRTRYTIEILISDEEEPISLEVAGRGLTLLRGLVRAANEDSRFNFALAYNEEDRFTVTELNGITAEWEISVSGIEEFNGRIDRFVPRRGATVTFRHLQVSTEPVVVE